MADKLNFFPNSKRFYDDTVNLENAFNNPKWMSQNQKLAGTANPKTLIAPIITPPCTDLSYWKNNNLVVHSAVNEESNNDIYKSGYQVSTCCAPIYDNVNDVRYAVPNKLISEYGDKILDDTQQILEENKNRFPKYNTTTETYQHPDENIESYQPPDETTPYIKIPKEKLEVFANTGEVNINCGYNPAKLIQANIPSNAPSGPCEEQPEMDEYNFNLYTQNIEPSVITTQQITTPINSNIGISFTQQIPPTTQDVDPLSGNMSFVEHDPILWDPKEPTEDCGDDERITEANVYDPRHTGYGTSYRSYTDEFIGQPRFYYDDVDAIRQPNYLVRSNIDRNRWADTYGPLTEDNKNGNPMTSNIRAMAHHAFLTDSLQHRTELQQRLMRKVNAEAWQQRKMPIYKSSGRMLGGLGSCK